jgi:hypothetical protein
VRDLRLDLSHREDPSGVLPVLGVPHEGIETFLGLTVEKGYHLRGSESEYPTMQ